MSRRFTIALFTFFMSSLLPATTFAEEIYVLSTTSAKEALGEVIPMFEQASAHKVRASFSPGSGLAARFASRVDADLLIAPADFSEPMLSSGQLVAGSRVDFARSVVALAVRTGAQKPDIRSAESFRQALLEAKSVAYSRGASGLQFVGVLERLGIAEAVKQKTMLPAPGELVGSLVARGAAELGVQQVSELLPVQGIEIAGPLPSELRKDIVYSISALPGRNGRGAARAFAEFLQSPAVRPVLKKHGLEPL